MRDAGCGSGCEEFEQDDACCLLHGVLLLEVVMAGASKTR